MDQAQPDDRNQQGSVSPEGERPLSEESVATDLSPEQRRELLIQEYSEHYKVLSALYLSSLDGAAPSSSVPRALEPTASVIESVLRGQFLDSSSLSEDIDRELSPFKDSITDRVIEAIRQSEGFLANPFSYLDFMYMNGADDISPVHMSITPFPNELRDAVASLDARPVMRDYIYPHVLESVVSIAEFVRDVDPDCHASGRLQLWLQDPLHAEQHTRFVFEKALSDQAFLEKFPYVMGDHLIRIAEGRLIEKEHFPSKWIDVVPGHCGDSEPTFAYRDFGWGLGVSTHFEMVLD